MNSVLVAPLGVFFKLGIVEKERRVYLTAAADEHRIPIASKRAVLYVQFIDALDSIASAVDREISRRGNFI